LPYTAKDRDNRSFDLRNDMELALQGNIKKFSLTEILQLIAVSRKSGTLGIQREDSIIMIYFQAGDIVYGYGPRLTFHLGQLLLEQGKISASQLEKAVAIQAENQNSKRLGEILISNQFIDRADLQSVIKEQVRELVYSMLSWDNGSFKFYENQFPTSEEITVCLSVENVILEGLRRIDEANRVRESLPDLDKVYTISPSQAGRTRAVTMKASEWNVMALVNGRRTAREIAESSKLNQDETYNRLAQLKLAGIIEPTEHPVPISSKDKGLENMVNRLSSLFENYLTQKATSTKSTDRNNDEVSEKKL